MTKLLVFGAEWCGPCRAMKSVVAELRAGGLDVQHVDVDTNEELATQYKVMAVPTFVVVKDDKEVTRASGAMPKSKLEALINA